MLYLLLALSGAIIAHKVYKFTSVATMPAVGDYLNLVKKLTLSNDKTKDNEIKSEFMKFVVELGIRSLDNQTGVGYFRLPQLGHVFVLSNPLMIKQFYDKKNDTNFSQLSFFNRLAVILGPDNLMSSPLRSPIHTHVRKSIFNRNEAFIPHLANIVNEFVREYSQQGQSMPLAEVMSALSRRVLLITYFDKCVVAPFEQFYDPELTQALLSSIFELETLTEEQHEELLKLRNKLFQFGSKLLLLPEVKKHLFGENNWINYLLQVRIEDKDNMLTELSLLGVHNTPAHLNRDDWELMLHYAAKNKDNSSLASIIRDVVNESLFIPLLGFDATATMLVTALRIAIQDPRINTIVKEEVKQLKSSNRSLELHDPSKTSYIEAVILEALRISPPAPIIPEIVTKAFSLDCNGSELELPEGALVFIPMEGLHTHQANYPDIPLSKKGQSTLNQTHIDSKTIFPERWKPVNPQGEQYNADFFDTMPSVQDSFFSFKKGARQCPGKRLALSEALGLFDLFNDFDFNLANEEPLNFPFSYDSPFQRNGGKGTLRIRSKTSVANEDTSQMKMNSHRFFSNENAPCESMEEEQGYGISTTFQVTI